MANAWVEHIKKYAKDNNVSYGCALSMPDCKASYQKTKESKPTTKESKEIKETKPYTMYKKPIGPVKPVVVPKPQEKNPNHIIKI